MYEEFLSKVAILGEYIMYGDKLGFIVLQIFI